MRFFVLTLLGVTFSLLTVGSSQVQPKPLSNDDVIQLVSLGFSDDVIIEKIGSVKATNFDFTVEGLKSLKTEKVSDAVLEAMMHSNPASPTVTSLGKAADQGNSFAEDNLGWIYEQGLGVAQDYQRALVWLRKAAEQGNSSAESNLGWMYKHGEGVTQDYQQALVWYRKAADQGLAVAENDLGWMYKDGLGVQQDEGQAVVWFRRAADQGNDAAELNLGYMYASGRGVALDLQQSLSWIRKAADHGNREAQSALDALPSAISGSAGQPVSTSNPQSASAPAVGSEAQARTANEGLVDAAVGQNTLAQATAYHTGKLVLIIGRHVYDWEGHYSSANGSADVYCDVSSYETKCTDSTGPSSSLFIELEGDDKVSEYYKHTLSPEVVFVEGKLIKHFDKSPYHLDLDADYEPLKHLLKDARGRPETAVMFKYRLSTVKIQNKNVAVYCVPFTIEQSRKKKEIGKAAETCYDLYELDLFGRPQKTLGSKFWKDAEDRIKR